MSKIRQAREQVELEVESFGQGGPNQPKEKTSEWFLLRARAISQTYLKRCEQLQLEDNPAAAEALYKRVLKAIKLDEPR